MEIVDFAQPGGPARSSWSHRGQPFPFLPFPANVYPMDLGGTAAADLAAHTAARAEVIEHLRGGIQAAG